MIGERASIAARIQEIIDRIRRLRASLYPADWTADPLYEVEKELQLLVSRASAEIG